MVVYLHINKYSYIKLQLLPSEKSKLLALIYFVSEFTVRQCYCMQLQFAAAACRATPYAGTRVSRHMLDQAKTKFCFFYARSDLLQYLLTYLAVTNKILAKKSQIFQRFCPLEFRQDMYLQLRICTMRFILTNLVRQVLLHLLEKYRTCLLFTIRI